MPKHLLRLLMLAAAVAAGCTGEGVNTQNVYDKISQTTKLTAAVADGQEVPTSVAFSIDGTALTGDVTNSGGQFSINFDSTKVVNGVHTVKAVGQPNDQVLLDATIYVENTGAAAGTGTGATAAPATAAPAG